MHVQLVSAFKNFGSRQIVFNNKLQKRGCCCKISLELLTRIPECFLCSLVMCQGHMGEGGWGVAKKFMIHNALFLSLPVTVASMFMSVAV